MLTKCEYCED